MANRALVVGVGAYGVGSGLSSHTTIAASARRYGEVLSRPSFMGPGNCRVLVDDEVAGRDVVLSALEQAAQETGPGDRLVVVYVGHGKRWRDAGNGQVHFATASSVDRTDWTFVNGEDLYHIIRRAKADLKVLIADCCYSDLLTTLGDSDDAVSRLGVLGAEHKGTCVLAAVDGAPPFRHDATSEGCPHLPGGLSDCTTFSGHLLALLENATDPEVARFTLGGLRDQLQSEMRSCHTRHPIPQMLLNRATDNTPIFPGPLAGEAGMASALPRDRDGWIRNLLVDRGMLPELMRDEWMAGDVAARLLELSGNERSALRRDIERSANDAYAPDAFGRYLSRANTGSVPAPPTSTPETVGQGTRDSDSANLEWVEYVEPGEFVQRLHVMREGQEGAPPMPTQTMRAMRDFAIHRPVSDLLKLASHAAGHDDAFQVLATAALRRTPEEAAELVVGHLRAWGGTGAAGAPGAAFETDQLVRNVLDDIAGQRTALDIADFLRACRAHAGQGRTLHGREADWAIVRTIARFTAASSGRSPKDKARLYVALHDMRYAQEADRVMRGSLTELDPGEHRPLADTSRTVEFAEALRTLSPAQPLLVDWIAAHFNDDEYDVYRRLVAQLLHSDPPGRRRLVERVMRLDAHDVVPIFRLLCGEDAAPHVFGEVQHLAASLPDTVKLAALVAGWANDSVLRSRTQEFLGDIVAGGSSGELRGRQELLDLVRDLDRVNAGDEWVQTLWKEAATRVTGRTGDDLVWLLQQIQGTRHRRAAEQQIALGLAGALLTGAEPPELFVQYLKALHDTVDYDRKTAVFLACKELADPEEAARRHRAPVVLARTAVLLDRARLVVDAVHVLERYMEDEHHTTAEAMCTLVRRLTADGFPAGRLRTLLQNTLGRWSDAGRRGSAVDALQHAFEHPDTEGGILSVVTALR